ncbi:polyhydroxyalkanoate synthesis regulator DNA-binding domain-containing protein [Desulfosarcina sp.]|uniref:polyhydroxyalkanoate synthesis regulator DNA-binding domain-containing protein n=1 Tax=Desulfosarcina sp. TaxID=2027861 RepID=UPI0029A984CA|nr:polyhydroxyalkanoate synthesis regulator DNA-binding domain-containing protein [Desulfosarcina sp.]MDX2455078.1 polyhydroxyalkanoate synthesis regulator DNA-binding domain-containing protein [Desulfosarcina sp.]MDX2512556.1 polyhydroxyalkanoate synthesis regulator DNA-binding domain-containing protein [Desulfobacterales bacterium]
MHKIKKYANRKMYDRTDKRYITMAQLSKLIKSGEEVSIVDNSTGDDLTSSIVSQLIGREEKDKDRGVSPRVLMQLLRKGGGTLTDYAKKYTSLWQNAFTMAEDEVDKLVNGLVKDKELSRSEGSNLKKEIVGYTNSLKSWISDSIDKRISEALDVMNLPTKDKVNELAARVDSLAKKIEKLEKSQRKTGKEKPKKRSSQKKNS